MSSSLEVTCIISGISRKLFGDFLKKKISDYGSSEILLKSFVSREARGLLRQGFSPEEVQQKLLPKDKQPFPIDLVFLNTLDLPIKRKKQKTEDDKPFNNITTKPVQHTSEEAWVKWATGNARGGTCISPQIRTAQRGFSPQIRTAQRGFCDGCQYYKYCQVIDKGLLR
jgi:hypothetical protein